MRVKPILVVWHLILGVAVISQSAQAQSTWSGSIAGGYATGLDNNDYSHGSVALALDVFRQARVLAFKKLQDVSAEDLAEIVCDHPLKSFAAGYDFAVPLLEGGHVTADTGTGFVHTAPGHGREDFDAWTGG
jgi:isoleucyl-tRNA synthetase